MIKHSVAGYPEKFLACMVSPTKICMQFESVTAKLRYKEGGEYVKLPDCAKVLPIRTTGTEVDILAVGAQMPVIEELQKNLIAAYLSYGSEHGIRYRAEYNKDFLDFLREIQTSLNRTIETLTRTKT